MSVLLIAEHNNSNLKVFTLNAIGAASKIDADIHVLVAGNNCENVAKEGKSRHAKCAVFRAGFKGGIIVQHPIDY